MVSFFTETLTCLVLVLANSVLSGHVSFFNLPFEFSDRFYGEFAYRVDVGCPGGPHPIENVDYPSEYKVHVYVMHAAAIEEITNQIQKQGLWNNPSGPQMYEMFAEGWSDNFAPVTFAIYLTGDQMEDADALEQQISRALGLP